MRGDKLLDGDNDTMNPQLTIVIKPQDDDENIDPSEATDLALKEFGVTDDDFEYEDEVDDFEDFMSPVLSSIVPNSIFNSMWSEEKIVKFLEKLGYNIIYNIDDNGETYPIALSNGEYPSDYDKSNVFEVFNNEFQDIILDWLLKIKTSKK